MSQNVQHDCEQHRPAEATSPSVGRRTGGNQPANSTAVPTHPHVVYPQPAHCLGAGVPVRLEPLMVAPSMNGLTCGVTQNVFTTIPAFVPSQQQQTVTHVLLPAISHPQWQCRWVMQPETTWITQSAIAPQRRGLCHHSQASCCQHPGQLGSLHPTADLGRTSNSQEETQRALGQPEPSRTGNVGIATESITFNDKLEQHIDKGMTTSHVRPGFAEILNKAMINTSSKLMALLEEELNRMDGEDERVQ